MTHVIKGEFVFFVHEGIMNDMKPLNLTKRDGLPGGLTKEEYSTRLNRVNMETALAIAELETRNACEMERKVNWFNELYALIE